MSQKIKQLLGELQSMHDRLGSICDELRELEHGARDEQDEHFDHHNIPQGMELAPVRNALNEAEYNVTDGMERIERAIVELNYCK